MDANAAWILFIGAGLAIAIVAAVGLLLDARRRRRDRPVHNDLQRAGSTDAVDGGSAGERATGSTSWMGPIGGGGAL